MRGAARLATYLGRIMVLAGFIVMFIGWNFAAGAEYNCAQCQFPFVLSASIPGLAFVIVGMSLEYVQTARELTARRAREAAQLDASLSRLVGFVRDGGAFTSTAVAPPAVTPDNETTLPPPTSAMPQAADEVFAPPAQPVAPAQTVVAGRSSFHDPACRLIASRDDLPTMGRAKAEGAGLAPCRICNP